MAARLIKGIRYVRLTHDNALKSLSFEDNLYHTLLDMWWNIEINDAFRLSHYISQLTGNIPFEKRTEDFKYYYALNNRDYIEGLYICFANLCLYNDKLEKDSLFDFWEIEDDDPEVNEIDMNEYMKYDDWWEQFTELFYKLQDIYYYKS